MPSSSFWDPVVSTTPNRPSLPRCATAVLSGRLAFTPAACCSLFVSPRVSPGLLSVSLSNTSAPDRPFNALGATPYAAPIDYTAGMDLLTGNYRRLNRQLEASTHCFCGREIPRPPYGIKPTREEKRYCRIACALKAERWKQRSLRAAAAQSASRQRRFCHICGLRISPERLRRWHNARSCGDACSVELRAKQKREAIARHKRRSSQQRAQERAAALVDIANCAVCKEEIPVVRRVRWPHVVTCSSSCADRHQKALVRQAKRRHRKRNRLPKPEAPK